MSQCIVCGSFAINHKHHGRDGSDPDLCDVCFWRKRSHPGHPAYELLTELVRKVHAAKGRFHTQLAMCDLYDAVGLKNERPATKTRTATREEKIVKPGVYEVND